MASVLVSGDQRTALNQTWMRLLSLFRPAITQQYS